MSVTELPKELQKTYSKFPASGQAKLLELHKKHNITDALLETFLLNNGTISTESLDEFKLHLEKEMAKKAAPRPVASAGSATPAKRSSFGGALPAGVAALLAGSGGPGKTDVMPTAKRARKESVTDFVTSGEQMLAAAFVQTPQASLKCTLGNSELVLLESDKDTAVAVDVLGDMSSLLSQGQGQGGYRWMNEPLHERASVQDARLEVIEKDLIEAMHAKHGDEIVVGRIGAPTQCEVVLCGRIVCEGLEGKLNERSMLLEGAAHAGSNAAPRVQLNVAACENVAAFPGQLVAVLGRTGMSGATFHAKDFLAGPPPAQRTVGPTRRFQIMAAAGPYCLRDGLDFAPLQQLVAHAVRQRPQVLVLQGPFIDGGNLKVASGSPTLPGSDEVLDYAELYRKHVFPMLASCLAPLRRATPPTEVVLVPSLDEVFCFHPMPQPPLDVSLCLPKDAFEPLRQLGVRFVSNPAHLNISGLRLNLCSADALAPILRELVLRPAGRKIEEALRLLVRQRTLFPALPRDPGHISEERAFMFDFLEGSSPEIVIFPSQMGTPTATFVDGTAFVNPGHLCRATLGNFAEISVRPAESGEAVEKYIRVDIQKFV